MKKFNFNYQRSSGTNAEHCCVPQCKVSAKYNSIMSFFTFPADAELRSKWVAAIRRDKFTVTPHTRVCSRHFKSEDIHKTASNNNRQLLKKGAVPVFFEWNNFSLSPSRPEVLERMETTPPETGVEDTQNHAFDPHIDHDYALRPGPAVVDPMVKENSSLRKENCQLRLQIETFSLRQQFCIHRFADSDKDIRFFTRFASYDSLMCFWGSLQESQKVQRESISTLEPIDEFFLLLNFFALGSKERDLADWYGIHHHTVSKVIRSWSNYLFTILGSVRIWIPEKEIRRNLPAEFQLYPDTTVILDCTELRFQCPSSPLLQSEVFSSYKSHCTLKGLIGIAPHGTVTFVSALFAGSASDKQITRESGVLKMLKPGMAVMVDKGFLIDDIVPCKVYRPAFLSHRPQMSAGEVRETPTISRLRVHMERSIRRIKEHKIFDSVIPLSVLGNINQLFAVACLLTNYENGPLGNPGDV